MNQALVELAVQEAPALLALLKTSFRKENPDAPEPTSEQVAAAYKQALQAAVAEEEASLTALRASVAAEEASLASLQTAVAEETKALPSPAT